MPRTPTVYILASRSRVLYVGVTSDMPRRWLEHQTGTASRFTAQYRVRRLVHVETCARMRDAIAREKEIKGWIRARKVALVMAHNPGWRDLARDWGWSVAGFRGGGAGGDPSLRSG